MMYGIVGSHLKTTRPQKRCDAYCLPLFAYNNTAFPAYVICHKHKPRQLLTLQIKQINAHHFHYLVQWPVFPWKKLQSQLSKIVNRHLAEKLANEQSRTHQQFPTPVFITVHFPKNRYFSNSSRTLQVLVFDLIPQKKTKIEYNLVFISLLNSQTFKFACFSIKTRIPFWIHKNQKWKLLWLWIFHLWMTLIKI